MRYIQRWVGHCVNEGARLSDGELLLLLTAITTVTYLLFLIAGRRG